jgi:uncharacterized protein YndB with AHSA1/START domain
MNDPIVIEQQTSATPEAVYRCLTQSDVWIRWQGASADLNPEPAGLFSMTMPDNRTARGEYVEVIPNRRIVFTWGWVDMPGLPPGSTTVTIDLEENEDGTLIRLTHADLAPEEATMHLSGWIHYLGRLSTLAGGVDPGPDPGPM